jgi:fructosamine-3-kinase
VNAIDDLSTIVGEPVTDAQPVSGGCINDARRVTTADGRHLFVKTSTTARPGMYEAEARGLRWLAEAGAPVPAVVAVREGDAPRGIALQWLEPAPPRRDRDEQLGRDLAALHRAGAGQWGLDHDNFIGDLPQPNTPLDTWAQFWAERRLRPFAAEAHEQGALTTAGRQSIERVAERVGALAGPDEAPARLHGDLWSGNAVAGPDGRTWLVDPAVYGGHREVDLAMMQLFGGFAPRTFAAYHEAFPLAGGWEERVGLWQLYPLLVHAVLFGGGYGARAAEVAARYA